MGLSPEGKHPEVKRPASALPHGKSSSLATSRDAAGRATKPATKKK